MISLTDDKKMLGYGLLGAYPNHFSFCDDPDMEVIVRERMLLLIVLLTRGMNLKK